MSESWVNPNIPLPAGNITRLVNFTLNTVLRDLQQHSSLQHTWELFPNEDNPVISVALNDDSVVEDGFWPPFERGDMPMEEVIGHQIEFDMNSTIYSSMLGVFILNESVARFEGKKIPLGGILIQSEPKPHGNGSGADVILFHDGMTFISINGYMESCANLEVYKLLESLIEAVTAEEIGDPEENELRGETAVLKEGVGTLDGFIRAWPDILAAANNLP